MLQQYVHFVLKRATGKMVIILMIVYIVFNVSIMGWGAQKINNLSGKEVQVLDLCLTGYSPAEVNTYLSEYSPEARSFAATFNAIADTVYPLVYTITISVLLAWVYKSRIQSNRLFGYLLLLPPLMMVLDFLENYHIIAMLRKFPAIPDDIVKAGSMLTVGKWGMLGIILVIIFTGMIIRLAAKKSRPFTGRP
jgi:ABC-type sugar transport system permease subunit